MKNKFLLDIAKKLSNLTNKEKVSDKVDVFTVEEQLLDEEIDCYNHLIALNEKYIQKGDTLIDWSNRLSLVRLKKQKLQAQVERLAKQEFIGQYQNRIKFYEEYFKEHTRQVNSDMLNVMAQLEELIPSLPEGSKKKAIAEAKYNIYLSQSSSQRQLNQLYDEVVDFLNANQ